MYAKLTMWRWGISTDLKRLKTHKFEHLVVLHNVNESVFDSKPKYIEHPNEMWKLFFKWQNMSHSRNVCANDSFRWTIAWKDLIL